MGLTCFLVQVKCDKGNLKPNFFFFRLYFSDAGIIGEQENF